MKHLKKFNEGFSEEHNDDNCLVNYSAFSDDAISREFEEVFDEDSEDFTREEMEARLYKKFCI